MNIIHIFQEVRANSSPWLKTKGFSWLRHHKNLAYKHIDEQNSTVGVACAGVDKEGNKIFGIRLLSDDGKEEWYDPQEAGSSTVLGWNDEADANFELENKVLPQIGYAIYQKDLQMFHRCMTDRI